MLRHALPFIALLLPVTSCSSTGASPEQQIAAKLWDQVQGHASWGHFEGKVGIQPGDGSHGKYIETQINAVAAADQDVLPPGSILIKSNYRRSNQTKPDSFVVMERRTGFDPRHYDWFYATFSPSGKVIQAGAEDSCVNCHRAAGDGDYVFYND